MVKDSAIHDEIKHCSKRASKTAHLAMSCLFLLLRERVEEEDDMTMSMMSPKSLRVRDASEQVCDI